MSTSTSNLVLAKVSGEKEMFNNKVSKQIVSTRQKSKAAPKSATRCSAQASRALKACDLCRKQKTRCLRSPDKPNSCVRCSFINKVCSFQSEALDDLEDNETTNSNGISNDGLNNRNLLRSSGDKLDIILYKVNELLAIARGHPGTLASPTKIGTDGKLGVTETVDTTNSMNSIEAMEAMGRYGSRALMISSELGAIDGLSALSKSGVRLGIETGKFSQSNSNCATETDTETDDMMQEEFSFDTKSTTLKTSPFSIIARETGFASNKTLDGTSTHGSSNILLMPMMKIMFSTPKRKNDNKVNNSTLVDEVLTNVQVLELVEDFRRNYGRWVSFPSTLSTAKLVQDLRQSSPLLLTTCCITSFRYSVFENKETIEIFQKLAKVLVYELKDALFKYTCYTDNEFGVVEFLQSLVVLSIYASSITSLVGSVSKLSMEDSELSDFHLDAWQLSSIGLTTFLTRSTFQLFQINTKKTVVALDKKANANQKIKVNLKLDLHLNLNQGSAFNLDKQQQLPSQNGKYETLTILRIFNHLCLVHIIHSVFSARAAVLDDERINFCDSALNLFNATNFDGRMVAEIGVLYLTYKYLQLNSKNSIVTPSSEKNLAQIELEYEQVSQELKNWHNRWEYLLEQPAMQFVEFTFNFCSMLIHYVHIYQLSYSRQNMQSAKNTSTTPTSTAEISIPLSSTTLTTSTAYSRPDSESLSILLRLADTDTLIKMHSCAQYVIDHANGIENDLYFAYLSDQIHFCCYFCALFYIQLESILQERANTKTIDIAGLKEFTKQSHEQLILDIQQLFLRFERIAIETEDDNPSRYATDLKDWCLKLFQLKLRNQS